MVLAAILTAAAVLLVSLLLVGIHALREGDGSSGPAEQSAEQEHPITGDTGALCAAVADAEEVWLDYGPTDQVQADRIGQAVGQVGAELEALGADDALLEPIRVLQQAAEEGDSHYDIEDVLQNELDGTPQAEPLADLLKAECPPRPTFTVSVPDFCVLIREHDEVDSDVLESDWSRSLLELGGPADLDARERNGLVLVGWHGASYRGLFDLIDPYRFRPSAEESASMEAFDRYVTRTCPPSRHVINEP